MNSAQNQQYSNIYIRDDQIIEDIHLPEYFYTENTKDLFDSIFNNPGYYIIESAPRTGKTAFIKNLWSEARSRNIPCIIAIFDEQRRNTSVSNSVYSVFEQLSKSINNNLPIDIISDIKKIYEHFLEVNKQLILLIDGIDESNEAERSFFYNILPNLPFTLRSGNHASFTIVITTRPNVINNLLDYLPKDHTLKGSMPYKLTNLLFSEFDIANNLSKITSNDYTQVSPNKVYNITNGNPSLVSVALNNIKRKDFSLKNLDYAEYIQWRDEFQSISKIISTSPEHLLLRKIITLIAISPSSLTISDISSIIDVELNKAKNLLQQTSRYVYNIRGNEYAIQSNDLGRYIENNEDGLFIQSIKQDYTKWIKKILKTKDIHLSNISLHALRHAAENITDDTALIKLFARRLWWEQLYKRSPSIIDVREALVRCWTKIVASYIQLYNNDSNRIELNSKYLTKLISCGLMISLFSETIDPSLVREIVVCGLWDPYQAKQYAQLYASLIEYKFIEYELNNLYKHSDSSNNFTNDIDQLYNIKDSDYSPTQKEILLRNWIINHNRSKNPLIKERLTYFISMLSPTDNLPSISYEIDLKLNDLIVKLSEIKYTGTIDDPELEPLLRSINSTWQQQGNSWQPVVTLGKILFPLSHYSRADFLQALELLAPSLQRHFRAEALDKLKQVVQRIVKSYL